MKFLVITDDSQLSQKVAIGRMDANQRWVGESRKKGTIKEIYSLAGNHGVAMVVDVDSPESLDKFIISMPAACDGTKLEIRTLADYDKAMEHLGNHFKHALSSMKSND